MLKRENKRHGYGFNPNWTVGLFPFIIFNSQINWARWTISPMSKKEKTLWILYEAVVKQSFDKTLN